MADKTLLKRTESKPLNFTDKLSEKSFGRNSFEKQQMVGQKSNLSLSAERSGPQEASKEPKKWNFKLPFNIMGIGKDSTNNKIGPYPNSVKHDDENPVLSENITTEMAMLPKSDKKAKQRRKREPLTPSETSLSTVVYDRQKQAALLQQKKDGSSAALKKAKTTNLDAKNTSTFKGMINKLFGSKTLKSEPEP